MEQLCQLCEREKTGAQKYEVRGVQITLCNKCAKSIGRKPIPEMFGECRERKGSYIRYSQDIQYRENIKGAVKRFKEKYPEKKEAWAAIQTMPKIAGCHLHHWSYNPEHYKDIILVRTKDHYKIHQYIQYDPETKMYKDKASGLLLHTKSRHAAYIDLILETY